MVIIPFALVAYGYAMFSGLAFRLVLREPRAWLTIADEIVAASALATTAIVCIVTCILRLVGRPIAGWAWFSVAVAVVTILGITAWRPYYFFVF